MQITIRDEHIKRGQAMKLAGLVGEGAEAKAAIRTIPGDTDFFVNLAEDMLNRIA